MSSLVAMTDLARGTGEAARQIKGRGIVLNGRRMLNPERMVTPADLLHGEFLALRHGRKRHHILVVKV